MGEGWSVIALTLSGVPPWDGRYEFEDFSFTNRELHRIKQLSGIRAGELIEALDANDTAAFVGVAAVVMGRYGKDVVVDDLWDSAVGSIRLDIEADDDDGVVADPPPSGLAGDDEPTSAEDGSGAGSETGGE